MTELNKVCVYIFSTHAFTHDGIVNWIIVFLNLFIWKMKRIFNSLIGWGIDWPIYIIITVLLSSLLQNDFSVYDTNIFTADNSLKSIINGQIFYYKNLVYEGLYSNDKYFKTQQTYMYSDAARLSPFMLYKVLD